MEAAKLGLIVGEGLLAREQLRVTRETGVDGIAPAMDDARVRQDEADEPREHEVRRHLVDDVPSSGRHRGHVGEISFAQRLELGRVQARRRLREPVDPVAQHLQPLELAGGVDHRMRSEDLLDQRRSRARHADNEYG